MVPISQTTLTIAKPNYHHGTSWNLVMWDTKYHGWKKNYKLLNKAHNIILSISRGFVRLLIVGLMLRMPYGTNNPSTCGSLMEIKTLLFSTKKPLIVSKETPLKGSLVGIESGKKIIRLWKGV